MASSNVEPRPANELRCTCSALRWHCHHCGLMCAMGPQRVPYRLKTGRNKPRHFDLPHYCRKKRNKRFSIDPVAVLSHTMVTEFGWPEFSERDVALVALDVCQEHDVLCDLCHAVMHQAMLGHVLYEDVWVRGDRLPTWSLLIAEGHGQLQLPNLRNLNHAAVTADSRASAGSTE